MTLLQIDSSIRPDSVSRALSENFAAAWQAAHPTGRLIVRDLGKIPLDLAEGSFGPLADELTAELEAADVIVIGAPMYNFGVSVRLKAWLDQVVRVGRTVMYGANGPQGQLHGKKVYVLTARGGAYPEGTPHAAYDFQAPYLRHVLGFLGMTDVSFVHAESQLRGPEAAHAAREAAREQARALAQAA